MSQIQRNLPPLLWTVKPEYGTYNLINRDLQMNAFFDHTGELVYISTQEDPGV